MAKRRVKTKRAGGVAKRTKTTPRPKNKSAAKAARNARPRVRVRMYRHGLGDCFLVTFDPGGDERHMLIDCGTLGAKTTGVKTEEVLDEISAATKGRLHLVVATHEHQDHVSGFSDRQNGFAERFKKIDHVWLAWTENPEDEFARGIAKYKQDLGESLAAVTRAPCAADVSERIRDVLGFFGDDHLLGAGAFAKTTHQSMENVRTGLGAQPKYLAPGSDPIEAEWLPGFRCYVLGPPRDVAALRNLGESGDSELYGISAGTYAAGLGAAGLAAAHAASLAAAASAVGETREPEECEREMPFDSRFSRQACQLWEHLSEYFAPAEEWRTIDQDWLRLTADLALQLDSMTNNTSLVLALERVADGKVLLFPGDAQQGNWLSWHAPELKWTVRDSGGSPREVTAAQLLKHAVFYKVGHHASHNATVKDHGLELMQQEDELTAFIPVDRLVALSRNPKGSWKMPARALYRRLLEKCQGRVARSDIGWACEPAESANPEIEREFVNIASVAEWRQWHENQAAAESSNIVNIKNLFVEFTLT